MLEGSGSGSRNPKNILIRIRIRNTGGNNEYFNKQQPSASMKIGVKEKIFLIKAAVLESVLRIRSLLDPWIRDG
jgi:hypothetical protein